MDDITEAPDEGMANDVDVGTQMTHRVTPSTKNSRFVKQLSITLVRLVASLLCIVIYFQEIIHY